jgi:hypothetical protein
MSRARTDDGGGGDQTLIQILEYALETGADAVEMEYADGGLEVCFMVGNTGMGRWLTDRTQINQLIEAIVKTAKLRRKSRGQMQLTLCGAEHTIFVHQYDSFGESAFRLGIDKPAR